MTKTPSIKTTEIDQYAQFSLHELEAKILQLQQDLPTTETKSALRALRQTLRQRQRLLKAKVMEFEQTNDHHLLIFDSTDNFSKIAGHSVLFYTLTIADRIHRRYSVKNDTDGYSRSEEGIVSVRALKQLEVQLAEINIYPDHKLSTSELHFYKLPRAYSEEQIAKLRDRSQQGVERISSLILPISPLPDLYTLILDFNRSLYHNCRRISDTLARDTIARQLLAEANELVVSYLNFANAKPSSGIARQQTAYLTTGPQPTSVRAQNLLNLLLAARGLRNNFANVENLHLMHNRELGELLEKLVEIERIAAREYARQLHTDK